MSNRREFLKFVAASPLFASASSFAEAIQETSDSAGVITSADEAINVFELEAAARARLPPAHWGYLVGSADGGETYQANQDGFSRFQLRPRRLVDVSSIDTSVELFGTTYETPIVMCPIGSLRTFHPDGDLAAARAASSRPTLQILSTQASYPIEDVVEARQAPIWYQLYSTNRWEVTEQLVRRAENAGCPALALTIDSPGGRNLEAQTIFRRLDTRNCDDCHQGARKPMFDGIEMNGVGLTSPALTWDVVGRLKDITSMRVLLKGLETGEDAALAVQAGADGIIVSNHGARATPTGRGTIEALPEIVRAVNGQIPILIDGGFRRGTDVFKALAIGATAVCIGRPYVWGLGSFGQAGVERVLDIFRREFGIVMRGMGARSLAEITPNHIVDLGRPL